MNDYIDQKRDLFLGGYFFKIINCLFTIFFIISKPPFFQFICIIDGGNQRFLKTGTQDLKCSR